MRFIRRTLSFQRWRTDYALLWPIALLAAFSVAQLVFGSSEGTVQFTELDPVTTRYLALVNLLGAMTCLVGLHLRDHDRGVTWESWGYVSLCGTMLIWVWLVIFTNEFPNTSYGLGFGEAFVFTTFHRLWYIIAYRRARNREDDVKLKLAAAIEDSEPES